MFVILLYVASLSLWGVCDGIIKEAPAFGRLGHYLEYKKERVTIQRNDKYPSSSCLAILHNVEPCSI